MYGGGAAAINTTDAMAGRRARASSSRAASQPCALRRPTRPSPSSLPPALKRTPSPIQHHGATSPILHPPWTSSSPLVSQFKTLTIAVLDSSRVFTHQPPWAKPSSSSPPSSAAAVQASSPALHPPKPSSSSLASQKQDTNLRNHRSPRRPSRTHAWPLL